MACEGATSRPATRAAADGRLARRAVSRRPVWLTALGVVALLLATACAAPAGTRPAAGPAGSQPPDTPVAVASPAATAPPVEHLRAAYTSTGVTQTPLWMAKDLGYFSDEGLDVELEYVPGSNVAIQGLLSGDLQFLIASGSTSVGATLGGGDAVILATTTGTFVISIMSVPELSPTVDSVRGHTLAVTRIGSTSDFVARYWLRRIGAEPVVDVPIVQVGGNAEMVAALSTGAADMVSTTDLFGLELQRRGYRELVNTADLGAEYIHAGLVSTRGYVSAHEDVTRRFLRAAMRGQARLIADRAEGIKVVSKYSQLDDPDVLGRAWELHTSRYIKRVPYTTDAAVQLALEELAPTQEQARDADPGRFYDNRFVRELDDAGFFQTLYSQ